MEFFISRIEEIDRSYVGTLVGVSFKSHDNQNQNFRKSGELWNTVVFPLDLGNKHFNYKGLDFLGLEPETVPASCGGFWDFRSMS